MSVHRSDPPVKPESPPWEGPVQIAVTSLVRCYGYAGAWSRLRRNFRDWPESARETFREFARKGGRS